MNSPIASAKRWLRKLFDRPGDPFNLAALPSPVLPVAPGTDSFELIPGKLKVKTFVHRIACGHETIHCWSFLTDGMRSVRQKEIIFTLRRPLNSQLDSFPSELVALLANIFNLAASGQVVDVGQSTLFSEAGVPGFPHVRGMAYVEPQGFPGIDTEGVPLMATILLLGDEGDIAWNFGATRITAMLGAYYRAYPFPPWSDSQRQPLASMAAMRNGFLAKISRHYLRGSYSEERKRLGLSIHRSSHSQLCDFLRQFPSDMAVAFLTQPHHGSEACLVWQQDASQPVAIAMGGSDGARKTGAFVAFLPGQEKLDVRPVEDGVAIFLSDSDWTELRAALVSGDEFSIPGPGGSGPGFSLTWAESVIYTSPITGDSFTANGWNTYEPKGASLPPDMFTTLTARRMVLLSSELDLATYTTVKDLSEYSLQLEREIDQFFLSSFPRTPRALAVNAELTPDRSLVRFAVNPELEAGRTDDLHAALNSVPHPKVLGPIRFDMHMKIWDMPAGQ